MTLTCSAFRATSVPDGFRLEIENETRERIPIRPHGDRLFYVSDLVPILKKTRNTIYKMGSRKRNPLPFSRGRGRPFCIESALWHWLQGPKGRGLC